MLYSLVYNILWPFFRIFYRFKVRNKKFIPRKGPIIIVANHQSYMDPIAVGLAVPRPVKFMAKSELFSIPVLKNLVTWLNAFPVRRQTSDRKAFKTAIQALNDGEVIGLFPEGTRVKGQQVGTVHPGAALMALKSEAALIPIGLSGTNKIIPDGKILPRFPKIRAVVGPPIDYNDLKGKKDKNSLSRLTELIGQKLLEVSQEAEGWTGL